MFKNTRQVVRTDFGYLRTGLSQEKNQPLDFKAAMVVGWASRAIPRLVTTLRTPSR